MRNHCKNEWISVIQWMSLLMSILQRKKTTKKWSTLPFKQSSKWALTVGWWVKIWNVEFVSPLIKTWRPPIYPFHKEVTKKKLLWHFYLSNLVQRKLSNVNMSATVLTVTCGGGWPQKTAEWNYCRLKNYRLQWFGFGHPEISHILFCPR